MCNRAVSVEWYSVYCSAGRVSRARNLTSFRAGWSAMVYRERIIDSMVIANADLTGLRSPKTTACIYSHDTELESTLSDTRRLSSYLYRKVGHLPNIETAKRFCRVHIFVKCWIAQDKRGGVVSWPLIQAAMFVDWTWMVSRGLTTINSITGLLIALIKQRTACSQRGCSQSKTEFNVRH